MLAMCGWCFNIILTSRVTAFIVVSVVTASYVLHCDGAESTDCTPRAHLPCTVVKPFPYCTESDISKKYQGSAGTPTIEDLTPIVTAGKTNDTSKYLYPGLNISWTGPDDDSLKSIKGFYLSLFVLNGHDMGKRLCRVFNLTTAQWNQADTANPPIFHHTIETIWYKSDYTMMVTIYSLPSPKWKNDSATIQILGAREKSGDPPSVNWKTYIVLRTSPNTVDVSFGLAKSKFGFRTYEVAVANFDRGTYVKEPYLVNAPANGHIFTDICPGTYYVWILVALRFLSTGDNYRTVADAMGVSRSSVSRCVRSFSAAICARSNRYIQFSSEEMHLQKMKADFYNIAEFPKIIGAIDGTHVPIQAPSEDEENFVNRKGFHSINVMLTCDALHLITSCVAKWPGSSHDNTIFFSSFLSDRFHDGDLKDKGILIGDSGYALKPYLMTPIAHPQNREEERYNRKHKATRVVIEQVNGELKARMRCLHPSRRLPFTPSTACDVIIACVCIHNICKLRDIPLLDDTEIVNNDIGDGGDDNNGEINQNDRQNLDGLAYRHQLIHDYFR